MLYAYICVDGFMARGVPRILKFVTVSEILLKILSPLTSWSVFIVCIDFPMASTWGIFFGESMGDFPVQRFGPLSHVFMSMFFLKW